MNRPTLPDGTQLLELEVLPGLLDVAADEITAALGLSLVGDLEEAGDDGTRLVAQLQGDPSAALALRTVVAAYLVKGFPVPRPKALLGDETLRALRAQITEVLDLHPPGTFRGLRIGAAGAGSSVFRRLAAELAPGAGLAVADDGELLVRVRPGDRGGWEVLVRMSPRPLSSRPWRTANVPGALNATLAAAIVRLSSPGPEDHVLNLMAGSGTLLIERLAAGPVALAAGLDRDPLALDAATQNLGGTRPSVGLVRADATVAPFPAGSWDCILADLPYGHRMGSHAENQQLHPRLLDECRRLLRPGGRVVVITHELRRFQAALDHAPEWRTARRIQVFQKGHHPCIWILRLANPAS